MDCAVAAYHSTQIMLFYMYIYTYSSVIIIIVVFVITYVGMSYLHKKMIMHRDLKSKNGTIQSASTLLYAYAVWDRPIALVGPSFLFSPV